MFVPLTFPTAFLLHCQQSESRADSNPPPIEIKATIQPARTATITAQLDGQVESIAVREGARVEANDLLVQLTNAVVERDAAVTRAQLDMLDARVRKAVRPVAASPALPRDTLEITAKILELRQQRLGKMKDLRRSNDVTARELEQAEIEYLTALRDYNRERQLTSGGAPVSVVDRELLEIERQKVAADERFAARRQAQLGIVSPIAGVVTRLHVTQGQPVFPRDPIAEVSDSGTFHVRGGVAPELLRYIRPGMRVDVRILSVPPRSFADEIEYVIPVSGSGPESRTATVVVTIPNPDGSLQPNTEALITLRSQP